MIPGVSISYQTALSTSILRLPAHPASALTIHPREIQALWSQNHDTGSYDTVLYQVDNSNNDVVIYWTMTGVHVVPDRQQYDRHTPIASCRRRYDTWCKYFISNRSFNAYSTTSSTPRVRADYLFILERYKFCNQIATTQAAMIRCTPY